MLIYFTTSIKTTLFLLLFTFGGLNLYANILPMYLPQNDTITTTKPAIPQADAFVVPENARKATINFQVNSEITYFSFSHFVKGESKKTFYSAWQKEKEARKLSSKTDSLRKSYANSSDDQKEKISTLILKAEQRQMALNEEIPALYVKVRNDETQYWQSASAAEKAKFREKIKVYQDSMQQETALANKQTLPDTITYYKAKAKLKPVASAEPVSALIYKIQVGAFKGKMPETAAKSIKKLSMLRKVENYKDEKGVTVYTTGSLKNYQDAITMQSQVKLEGIKNATIAVYNNGKKITLEEARKLTNEPVKP
jgi:hypothetical protein